jgi:hypothetical protein
MTNFFGLRDWVGRTRRARGRFPRLPPSGTATFAETTEVRKKTEITVETDEVLVVRRARIYQGWCGECGRVVDMVDMPDARAVAGISERNAAMRAASWHVSDGSALVCMESLLKSIGHDDRQK